MELVSVILPTYNRAKLVGDAVRSVVNQSFHSWELIIIDDGSSDNTEDVLRPFLVDSRIRYVKKQNEGASAARNAGLKYAKGDFVAFIDSDDLWKIDKLGMQMEVFRRYPNVHVVFSDFSALSSNGTFELSHIKSYFSVFEDYELGYEKVFSKNDTFDGQQCSDRYKVFIGNIYETMIFGNVILTSTTICRREVFAVVGVFDTGYSTLEDYDLFLKMTKAFDVAFVDVPLLMYRYNANQLSGEAHFEQLCHNLSDIFEKNIGSMPEGFLGANMVRIKKHRAMIERQLGYFYFTHGNKAAAARHYWRSMVTGSFGPRAVGWLILCFFPDFGIVMLKRVKNTVLGQRI